MIANLSKINERKQVDIDLLINIFANIYANIHFARTPRFSG